MKVGMIGNSLLSWWCMMKGYFFILAVLVLFIAVKRVQYRQRLHQ
ncbi:hypothetical protein [Megamonas hypermegale]|nr:hypothetical protein [Megamonas hypermegale]